MSESSIAVSQFIEEPPLSPSSPFELRSARRSAAPAPAAATPSVFPERPSLEAQLRCYRELSRDQIQQAFREGAVNYQEVIALAYEHAWIVDDVVAHEVVTEPEPELEVITAEAALVLELSNGERIVAGRFPNREDATNYGRQLAFKLGHESEWPIFDGRYVRPDAIFAIAIETLES
jgi:hypothetical protein